jgi:[acyl-carrier-protein] S-malonyltransferase
VLVGVVFPGQGSQTVGMLSEMSDRFPIVKKTFDAASQALGYDLWQLTQSGPTEELDKTVHTQPALLAASYAIWKIISEKIKPSILAGHSLGEYTALLCAEVFSFEDAVKLVAARGKFMQEAVPFGEGALAAIVGLENNEVQTLCEQSALSGEILSPANFNCPGQVVISGHKKAVERALILAKEKGAKLAKLLPVSVPSHSALMKPAAEHLADLLKKINIQSPKLAVLNNVDVTVYKNADEIRDGLVRQLFMPVRWVETIQQFKVDEIIECGPGKILNGLNKRIAPNIQLTQTSDLDSLKMRFNL